MFEGKSFGRDRPDRGGFRKGGFGRRRDDSRFRPREDRPAGERPQGEEHHHADMKDAQVVVPGELLEESARPMAYAFVDEGKTYSSVMGLYCKGAGKIVPLEGAYMPNQDDVIVGVVTGVKFSGYVIDLKSPYIGFLSSKETRDEFKLGDVVSARVKAVDEVKNVDLTEASRLDGGQIIEILSVKIPRVIGKKSSMIRMIQDATQSEMVVGKNGRVWVRGGNSALAVQSVLKIEKEAHTRGLTDRISGFLKSSGTA